MKRIMMMVALAAFLVAALSVSALSAFAASQAERDCDALGGTYTKEGSTAKCVLPEQTVEPKNERQADKFQLKKETTNTGQGNLRNKEDSDTTTTCGHPCPPGQFPGEDVKE